MPSVIFLLSRLSSLSMKTFPFPIHPLLLCYFHREGLTPAAALPRSLLEMQALGPHPRSPNVNLHFNKTPPPSRAHPETQFRKHRPGLAGRAFRPHSPVSCPDLSHLWVSGSRRLGSILETTYSETFVLQISKLETISST